MLPKSLRVTRRVIDSAFAMPKSSTLMRSSSVMRTFFGFRSPWSSDAQVAIVERHFEAVRRFEKMRELGSRC